MPIIAKSDIRKIPVVMALQVRAPKPGTIKKYAGAAETKPRGKKSKITITNGQVANVLTSRALERETVFGALYQQEGMSGALRPPYDPDQLHQLVEENNALDPCVSAMVTNVDGTGFEIISADPDKEVPPNILDTLTHFFDAPWPNTTFLSMRKRLRRDLEITGNAYVEVIRNLEGEIALIRRMDPCITRIMRLGNDSYTEKVFSATLNEEVEVAIGRRRFVQYSFGELVYFKEFGAPLELDRVTGQWEDVGTGGFDPERKATEVIHIANVPHHILPYGIPRWIAQIPSVVGSRKAEEFNVDWFNQGGVPPMLIVIQGGQAADNVEQAVRNLFYSAGPNKTTAAILQVQSTTGEIDAPGSVSVKVERFGCYDEETEILTEDGWCLFANWKGQQVATVNIETGALEYDYPVDNKLLSYDYEGEMIRFEGPLTDCCVTPNHKMLTLDGHGTWILGTRADALTRDSRTQVMSAPSFVGAPVESHLERATEEFIQFLCHSVGTPVENDRIPRSFMKLSSAHSQTLLLGLFDADLNHVTLYGNGRYVYTALSKGLADDIQEMVLRCGWNSRLDQNFDTWKVSVYRDKMPSRCSRVVDTVNFSDRVAYKGRVYCFTMPNHTIVTRRNGMIAIHGNSDVRQKDMMFQQYDASCETKVRRAFRLPEMFVGSIKELNFASALASYRVAEAQVFKPERDHFDELMNKTLIAAIVGPKDAAQIQFRSFPVTAKDMDQQIKALTLAVQAQAISAEELVENINEITGLMLDAAAPEERAQVQVQLPGSAKEGKIREKAAAQAQNANPANSGKDAPNIQIEDGPPNATELVNKREIQKDEIIAALADDAVTALKDDRPALDSVDYLNRNPQHSPAFGRHVAKRLYCCKPDEEDAAGSLASAMLRSSL